MAKSGSLAVDPLTGDLARSAGSFALVADGAYLVQKVRSVLLFFRGEWFLDLTGVGLPYYEQILGVKNPNLDAIRSTFQQAILGVQGVVAVDSLDLEFDRSARTLRVRWAGLGDLGQLLTDSFEVPTR